MIRSEVTELVTMGAFPSSQVVDLVVIKRQQELLNRITHPVSDTEACELVKLFGPDDYFGNAWTLLHLIESAPHWPLQECLLNNSNEWVDRMKKRISRKDVSTVNEPQPRM